MKFLDRYEGGSLHTGRKGKDEEKRHDQQTASARKKDCLKVERRFKYYQQHINFFISYTKKYTLSNYFTWFRIVASVLCLLSLSLFPTLSLCKNHPPMLARFQEVSRAAAR